MLYTTTRNLKDTYTCQRALTQDRAPDGGFYIPFREPCFDPAHLQQMQDFRETTVEMLNLLFGTRLTAWDLEYTIGRHPVRISKIGRRTLSCERWRNPRWTFQGMVQELTDKIRVETGDSWGPWAEIGVGIATLFGLFGKIRGQDLAAPGEKLDVAVSAGNLRSLISVWYARAWGLPIGTIICGCSESSGLWDLLHNGEMPVFSAASGGKTDVCPEEMEILMHLCGGQREAQRYVECCRKGKAFRPMDLTLERLKAGLSVSVISEKRTLTTIPAVYSTHRYLLSPSRAAAYAGLRDYRAGTSAGSWGLILCDRGPNLDEASLGRAMGVSPEQIRRILNQL